MPATTWIVAADATRARILQPDHEAKRLAEIEDLVNPGARLPEREINSDARGRFPGGDTWQPAVSADEHLAELFAKRVGERLEQARNEHRFDRLYLAAPPKFLGLLRRKLSKEVQKLVVEELDKDVSWLNARDLERYWHP